MGYPVDNIYTANGDGTGGEIGMGAAAMNYIPTLYAGKLLVKFYEASVLSDCSNTDYEGMIRDQGDSVIIRTLPTITVTDHEKGMVLANQEPSSVSITLNIDQGKYWSFRTDDPDPVQTDLNGFIGSWTQEAAYELRNAIEIDVLEGVHPDAGHKGANQGAQSASFDLGVVTNVVHLTKDGATGDISMVDAMIDCGTVLDESNVPDEGRFFLLPPAMVGLIKKSELKDASLAGDATSIIRNGLVGMIDRFKVYRTGNLEKITGANAAPCANAWYTLFGTKHAITFASQLVKNKVIDNPNGFGMLHRGLQVYGFKVVKPEALGCLLGGVAV